MRVFVAGATGAIGRPLIAELIGRGHDVTGMTRSLSGRQSLMDAGASVAEVDVFDAGALEAALAKCHAEIVIDQLTSLPRDPANYAEAFPMDKRLRLEGGGNLHRAARACGVRRYMQQSSGFFLKAEDGLADESAKMAIDASGGIAASAQMYSEIEARLKNSGTMEAVALRYGFFYGPNTWYSPGGAAAEQARAQRMPIIGRGEGVWSFVHVDDAAVATAAALSAPPGVYNIVDDDPSPAALWLPAFARFVGAPAPSRIAEQEARARSGEDAVYYGTRLHGASNRKARETFGFRPRRLEWLAA